MLHKVQLQSQHLLQLCPFEVLVDRGSRQQDLLETGHLLSNAAHLG